MVCSCVLRRLGPGLAPAGADPLGLKDRVAELFDSWVRLVEDAPCDKVHEKFVEEARAAGLLKARPHPAATALSCLPFWIASDRVVTGSVAQKPLTLCAAPSPALCIAVCDALWFINPELL